MDFEEFLDLPLRVILEDYCLLHNLECGYYYGIVKQEKLEELYKKYDINSYKEAFYPDTIIPLEVLQELDKESVLLDDEKLDNIMSNLNIKRI